MGMLSPDGRWQWNGVQWMPVSTAAPAAALSARSMLTLAGGLVAVLGEAAILVSYFLPYSTWDATADYPAGSYSIFGIGPWETAGALVAIAAGVAAAIVVLALTNRIAIGVASGALMAFGLQSLTDWIAISGTSVGYNEHLAAGSFVGAAGSIVLFLGGLIALLSLFARRPA